MIPNKVKIIYEVTRKELFEHFKTKRLLVLSIIFIAIFFIMAVWGGIILLNENTDEPAYESGANNVLILMLTFTGILFPGILAIALSYDTIVGERTRRSLHLIVSKPVDRSSIYIGKFLGAFLSIVLLYLLIGTIGYGTVIIISGKTPSLNEVGKAYTAIGLVLFSAACWVLFTMLFSTSFKTVTSTILVSIFFWFIILPLLAFSGQLYYIASSTDSSEETITVDFATQVDERFAGINSTVLTFQPHRYDIPILGVEFEVQYANGTSVKQMETSGGSLLSLVPTYILEPGTYSWTAKYNMDKDKDLEVIATGSLIIDEEFLPSIFQGNTQGDNHDDFALSLGYLNRNPSTTFNITVYTKDMKEIIEQEIDYSEDIFFLLDLDEGDYRISVIKDGKTYLNSTFHSYGKTRPQNNPFLIDTDAKIEYPGYVKLMNAMSPDNSASVYRQILTGESTALDILTIQEGLLALTIEFITLLLLGLFIFSRIELL